MQDLPQLLCQDKINIDSFLGVQEADLDNDNNQDDVQDNLQRVIKDEKCCIESKLYSPMLPILGNPEMVSKKLDDFTNIFEMRYEIEEELIEKESDVDEYDDAGKIADMLEEA